MSSAATIEFNEGEDEPHVSLDDWCSFCVANNIEHHPATVGGNVYYFGGLGGVECTFESYRLRFSTFFMDRKAMPDVARLSKLAWLRWGGHLRADAEIRSLICSNKVATASTDDDSTKSK